MISSVSVEKEKLIASVRRGSIAHSCLFAGEDPYVNELLAGIVACFYLRGDDNMSLLAQTPDYVEISGSTHTEIKDARAFAQELISTPSFSGKRVILIKNTHKFKPIIQELLLKPCEEPRPGRLFLLTGVYSDIAVPLRSRCAVIRSPLLSVSELEALLRDSGADTTSSRLYARIGDGLYDTSFSLFTDERLRALRDNSLEAITAAFDGRFSPVLTDALCGSTDDSVRSLSFMLSFCRDVLRGISGIDAATNIDKQAAVTAAANRFTTKQINRIIDLLVKLRASAVLPPYKRVVFDRLFSEISEVLHNE